MSVSLRHPGQPRGAWWLLLVLLAAVLVPSACVLWFMNAAMRDQTLAQRQRWIDLYTRELEDAKARLDEHWRGRLAGIEQAGGLPPPQAFERVVRSGLADAVLLFDAQGRLVHPSAVAPPADETGRDIAPAKDDSTDAQPGAAGSHETAPAEGEQPVGRAGLPATATAETAGPQSATQPESQVHWSARWEAARAAEAAGEFQQAAQAYAELSEPPTPADRRALAMLAHARCLARVNRRQEALAVLAEMNEDDLLDARDAEGRLLASQAMLYALELTSPADDARRAALAQQLATRLADYTGPAMPASQRLFLMMALESSAGITCPTLSAERLAAEAAEQLASGAAEAVASLRAARGLRRFDGAAGVWALPAADGAIVALLRQDAIDRALGGLLPDSRALPGARAELAMGAPPRGPGAPLVSMDLAPAMPGWYLGAWVDDPALLASAADRQNAVYLYTGAAGVTMILALTAVAGGYLRRQIRLARLKNDFIATITHELKTPLASMRVLVDTLRQGRCRDGRQASEYLDLIARENERLSRMIDNFLGFSRMERNKRAFEMAPVDVNDVAEAAVEAVQDRFAVPARLEVELAASPPMVQGDRDALVTVVLNLLDNAWKYSQPPQWVRLRTAVADGAVVIEVADRGIGLSRRSMRRIFERFYQVDQTLSRRAGGCGLGLAIVKFILDAHGGSIDVRSQPGKGSTFTVRLPVEGPAPRASQ